jgi:DNA-directed RNA polymerase specialized sigma24 family protein
MSKDWILSQECFDALLDWLDSKREQAGIKYEEIRSSLIKMFSSRGISEAEDLADETINRVARKLNEIEKEFEGDPARYFFGVGNKVYLEYLRRKLPQLPPLSTSDSERVELEYSCLERCINRLSVSNRNLLLRYYGAEGRAKIDQRRLLADELGIAPNALRIRAFRIRTSLQKCVEKCVEH